MKTHFISLISKEIDEARLKYIEAKDTGDLETATFYDGKLTGMRQLIRIIVKEID